MKTQIIRITPEIAESLLLVNDINRPVAKRNIAYWKGVISSPDYFPTHQGIALQGISLQDPIRLLDGQHRLIAISESGVSADFNVTFGANEKSFENIDCGKPRSMRERTSINNKELEILHFLFRSRSGEMINPTAAKIKELHSKLAPYMEMESFNTSVRGLTVAAIRAAFVLHNIDTQEDHWYGLYVTGKFEELTSSLCALYRRATTNPISGGSDRQLMAFAAAHSCLKRPNLMKIHVPNNFREYTQIVIEETVFGNKSL
jgi:hypothetical protein